MAQVPKPLRDVIAGFALLPGVGPKSASRLAYYLLKSSSTDLESFAQAISDLKSKLTNCEICNTITENKICDICQDQARTQDVICVVEEPLDIIALEKSGSYQGLYHVLGGALNPMEGIGPEDLTIQALVSRVKKNNIQEIILATNATLEGETTARYIASLPEVSKIKISRLAHGLPAGSDIEYADEVTLGRALEGRTQYN